MNIQFYRLTQNGLRKVCFPKQWTWVCGSKGDQSSKSNIHFILPVLLISQPVQCGVVLFYVFLEAVVDTFISKSENTSRNDKQLNKTKEYQPISPECCGHEMFLI
jgi:hypothetical protein